MHIELIKVTEIVYDKCGLKLTNLNQNLESHEYGACSFELDNIKVQYRISKKTPTKVGQFVTIWKRNPVGITIPFDELDDFDFIIIASISEVSFGQFIFSKSILAENGIITCKGKEGKRGIRVYPPWDQVTSKQALKTQNWQTKYFLEIENNGTTDLELFKKLINK